MCIQRKYWIKKWLSILDTAHSTRKFLWYIIIYFSLNEKSKKFSEICITFNGKSFYRVRVWRKEVALEKQWSRAVKGVGWHKREKSVVFFLLYCNWNGTNDRSGINGKERKTKEKSNAKRSQKKASKLMMCTEMEGDKRNWKEKMIRREEPKKKARKMTRKLKKEKRYSEEIRAQKRVESLQKKDHEINFT